MPHGMQGEPALARYPRSLDRSAGALAHVAVVEPAPERVAEDVGVGALVDGGHPVLAESVASGRARVTSRRAAGIFSRLGTRSRPSCWRTRTKAASKSILRVA